MSAGLVDDGSGQQREPAVSRRTAADVWLGLVLLVAFVVRVPGDWQFVLPAVGGLLLRPASVWLRAVAVALAVWVLALALVVGTIDTSPTEVEHHQAEDLG